MSEDGRLGSRVIAAYGAPAIVLAAVGFTFYIYLPKYYADVVGIDLTILGIIVLASRVWDALIDPAFGALSDRTQSRFGRRLLWMGLGALPLAVSFILLISLPDIASSAVQGLYLAALTFLFFLFWTMVDVPYEALGAELSFDYDERIRLLGVREAGVLVGVLLAAVLPVVVGLVGLPDGPAGERVRFWRVGLVYAALTLLLIGWCLAVVRERSWLQSQVPHALLQSLSRTFRNRPFKRLLTAYSLTSLGASLTVTTLLFYAQYVLGTDRGPVLLVLFVAVATAFVPMWLYLARRLEKKSAWMLALAVHGVTFSTAIFLGRGDTVLFTVIVALSAVGLGGISAIPPAMQADIIDYDEWSSGERREGEYIGFWAVVKKLAAALSAGLALPILDAAGYVPAAAVQPASAAWALRILCVAVPSLCYFAAIAIVWRYPIDRALHHRIRSEIDDRLGGPRELNPPETP